MGRVLGLDFGTRRVGAALSDPRRLIATPLEGYERRDRAADARHYRHLADEHEVDLLVVGLPLHTGGGEGDSARLARDWGAWLAEATGLPLRFFDERYTTIDAEDVLVAAGLKRAKRAGYRDMLAARILLQNFLDAGCPEFESRPTPIADAEDDS